MLKVHADEDLLLAITKEFLGMYILASSYSSIVHFYGRRLYSPLMTSFSEGGCCWRVISVCDFPIYARPDGLLAVGARLYMKKEYNICRQMKIIIYFCLNLP